jgi:hypothetical protein
MLERELEEDWKIEGAFSWQMCCAAARTAYHNISKSKGKSFTSLRKLGPGLAYWHAFAPASLEIRRKTDIVRRLNLALLSPCDLELGRRFLRREFALFINAHRQ